MIQDLSRLVAGPTRNKNPIHYNYHRLAFDHFSRQGRFCKTGWLTPGFLYFSAGPNSGNLIKTLRKLENHADPLPGWFRGRDKNRKMFVIHIREISFLVVLERKFCFEIGITIINFFGFDFEPFKFFSFFRNLYASLRGTGLKSFFVFLGTIVIIKAESGI